MATRTQGGNASGNSAAGNAPAVAGVAGTLQRVDQVTQSNAALLTELQAALTSLDTQRSQVVTAIQKLGGTVEGLEPAAPVTRRRGRKAGSGNRGRPKGSGRSRNGSSLNVSVATVLNESKADSMSPDQVAAAVKAGGYQTSSENYPQMVSQTLSRLGNMRMGNRHIIKRVSRGQYAAAAGAADYIANPSGASEA